MEADDETSFTTTASDTAMLVKQWFEIRFVQGFVRAQWIATNSLVTNLTQLC